MTTAIGCGCLRCQDDRFNRLPKGSFYMPGTDPFFRYACELCGNKRCPHHTNHRFQCSRSNIPGQAGSAFS